MKRPNPPPPDRMSPTDHLTEVATILALGIRRLRAPQGAPRGSTEETVRLDFAAHGSGHAPPRRREVPGP